MYELNNVSNLIFSNGFCFCIIFFRLFFFFVDVIVIMNHLSLNSSSAGDEFVCKCIIFILVTLDNYSIHEEFE